MADAVPPALQIPAKQVYLRSAPDRLWQGEIIETVPQVRLSAGSIGPDGATENPEIETDPHPFAIVLSQDCDLEQDFKARQADNSVLSNVLLCDLFQAEELRLKLKEAEQLNSREWKVVRQNNNFRFQFLRAVGAAEDLRDQGLPAMAVDFRLHFTIRTEELYQRLQQGMTFKRARLDTPFAEHLCDRFYHYMARIALPVNHADGAEP